MRFWDTSAILPLIVHGRDSRLCRDALLNDPRMVVWVGTRLEIASALARRIRAAEIDKDEYSRAASRVEKLSAAWVEFSEFRQVLDLAEDLIAKHPLRAGDAQQLAAAKLSVKGFPKDKVFVTRDDDLADAAARERFAVIRPVEA